MQRCRKLADYERALRAFYTQRSLMDTFVHPTAAIASDPKPTLRRTPIILEPTKQIPINIRELWEYRELLYFLIWRDLKVRYKQTILGAAWVLMQPLVMTLVFTIFLGHFARVPSAGIPYALLVFSGLIPWMFFSAAVISCGNSLVTNAQLITKVYFPRVIVPLATIGARLVDFAISLVILAGLMYYYRIPLTWKIAALPFFVIALTALALAVGMLTSAWNVKYRDVGIMLPVLVQLWMFVSPIVYPIEIVPERWRRLYALNPLAGLIGGFRALLLNRELDLMALLMSVATIVSLLVYALYVFRRMQRNFADII